MGTSVGSHAISLTDDMLVEIFNKHPLKTVSRFRCVSKPWHQLINNECIRTRHPLIISGVFYYSGADPRYGSISNGRFSTSDLSFFPFHHNSQLIDCCNGLLLFFSWTHDSFYVCNPATQRWVALPKPHKRTLLSILVFDPCRSPHYKVICFTGWRAQGAELEVLSSNTMKWAEREVHWGVDTDAMSATMRYFDGSLHILAYPQQMVSIDLDDMTCNRIELPEPANHDRCMGKSGGHLYFTNKDGEKLRIWMLDKGSKPCKWVLKYIISVPETRRDLRRGFNFLAFHPEMEIVYVWVPGKVVSYDLESKRFEVVCELREEMESAYFLQLWLFPSSRFMSECLTDLG